MKGLLYLDIILGNFYAFEWPFLLSFGNNYRIGLVVHLTLSLEVTKDYLIRLCYLVEYLLEYILFALCYRIIEGKLLYLIILSEANY